VKQSRLLSLVTFLAAIPLAVIASLLIIIQDLSPAHGLVMEKLLLCSAVVVAGILLWQGHRRMNWVGLLVWLLLVYWGINSLKVLTMFSSFEDQMAAYVIYIAYIALGFPVMGVMAYRQWRAKQVA
jgi:uncharacterized membrane protein